MAVALLLLSVSRQVDDSPPAAEIGYVLVLLGETTEGRLKLESALERARSAGITDLRYGHVLDEDWHGHDRFQPKADKRQLVPLPEGVACFTVAATIAARAGASPQALRRGRRGRHSGR